MPSRNSVKKAFKNDLIFCNGKVIPSSTFLLNDDKIDLYQNPVKQHKTFPLEFPVIFEDNYLAVIYKPAGYDVSGNKYQTIQNALSHNLTLSSSKDALAIPRPVHRLDNQTSGLLIIAKTYQAVKHLSQQFENRQIQKEYQCLIQSDNFKNCSSTTKIDGLEAHTSFEIILTVQNKYLGDITYLKAIPKTGRRHQIRKHLAEMGFPILGDKVYGEHYSKGLFLFAFSITFVHPVTGKEMFLELPVPKKFNNILTRTHGKEE